MYSVEMKNYVNIVVVYNIFIMLVVVMLCRVNMCSGINGCDMCDLMIRNVIISVMVMFSCVSVCVDV